MTDTNYFSRVSVDTTNFPATAQIIIPTGADPSISLVNEGTDIISYSFDGLTVHGDLKPNSPSASIIFNHRGISKIWLKGATGTATNIRCEASANGSLGGLAAGSATVGTSGQTTATSSAASMQNVLPTGKYSATPPTLTDGQFLVAQLNSEGDTKVAEQFASQAEDNTNGVFAVALKPIASATYSPSILSDFGSNVTKNVKASAGALYSFYGSNSNALTRYLQFHNTASTPAGGAVPVLSIAVKTSGEVAFGAELFNQMGLYFSTGIAYAWSTTAGTYTAATASDHLTTVLYK